MGRKASGVMTVNLGQFGGVFWHDPEKGEQEVVNPENDKPVQGMLFHPLTGTGIPGDPLQTSIGRERDVRNAFGFSFPDVEKSGIPRSLLGTQETNPTLSRLSSTRSASGTYDPENNTISIRDEGHIRHNPESVVHELGHARDRSRLIGMVAKQGHIPEAEGVADAYRDRFSSQNIMNPSGSLDPLINPSRSHEIMKETISRLDTGQWRISGYGGNSMAWRDKAEQATYALSRMLGALNPSGTPTRKPSPHRANIGRTATNLSNVQLTKPQQKQHDIGKAIESKPGWFKFTSRDETLASRTVDIGRLYKHNPRAKALLDDAGLEDLGKFASHVHTANLEDKRLNKWEQRKVARSAGHKYDTGTWNMQPIVDAYRTGISPTGHSVARSTRLAFLQPSLFEHDTEAMNLIDPKPEKTITADDVNSTRAWMKQNKVKKPSKRDPSEWEILENSIKEQKAANSSNLFKW